MMLADAIAVAGQVGPVVPLKGKRPVWNDWTKRGTREPAGPDWEQATGVGVVTGERAGCWVLDLDAGKGGPEALAALEQKHGALPPTWTVATGGGGVHLYWRWPTFVVRNTAGKIGPGIDTRGEGGQVAAPPSLHPSGRRYEWAPGRSPADLPLADAPPWLLALLMPAAVPPPSQPPASERAYRRASAYLARIPGAISGSGGHNDTWRAALAIVRGFSLSEGDAYYLLASEYNPRCAPPWSEAELRHKVQSAAKDATVPWGYLLDAERPPPAASRTTPRDAPRDDLGTTQDDPPAEGLFQDATAFLAKEVPPVEWLLAPWLPARSMAIMVAPPNAGKTLEAFDMVAQVCAAGRRAVVVEDEGSEAGFQTRLKRSFAAVGNRGIENLRVAWNSGLSLLKGSGVATLKREVESWRADLLVLDSLAALSEGMEEKNSEEMSLVAAALHRLKGDTGCAVLVLHHMTKEAWKPGEKPSLASVRGHGALAARADTILALVPLVADPGEVAFEVHTIKQRDAERATPRVVAVTMTGPAAETRISERDDLRAAQHTAENVTSMMAKVLERLPDHPGPGVSKRYLENIIEGRAVVIRAAVDRLTDCGKAVKMGSGYMRPPASGTHRDALGTPPSSRSSPVRSTGTNPGTRGTSRDDPDERYP